MHGTDSWSSSRSRSRATARARAPDMTREDPGTESSSERLKERTMPSKSANVKNQKQYEALKDKGIRRSGPPRSPTPRRVEARG